MYSRNKIRVLHLSKWERWPGGVIALNRLHKGLTASNEVESHILTQNKVSFSDNNIAVAPIPNMNPRERFLSWLRYYRDCNFHPPKKETNPYFFSHELRPNCIARDIITNNYDLVHIHFTGFNFLPTYEISQIKKQIAWTIHNPMPFTGGCSIQSRCRRYEHNCGRCPVLGSETEKDMSYFALRAKKKYFRNIDPTIIAPSTWMADCIKRSALFGQRRIKIIPNGIDTGVFRPIEKKLARLILNLPQNKIIILFGAENFTLQPHKGFDHFISAINQLNRSEQDICLAFFGSNGPAEKKLRHYPQYFLDSVRDERTMALIYAAADIFVAPYHLESFGQTILESMSCGTPVAAFRIGGPVDLINHKINGYLAKPYEIKDLANGIRWILDHLNQNSVSGKAREKAVKYFDIDKITKRHIELYQELKQETT